MTVETVRMSSKGQIVIPFDVREELNAHSGTVFAVVGNKDTVILKKVETPNKEELLKRLEHIAQEGKKRLSAKGIREEDIPAIVERSRRRKS